VGEEKDGMRDSVKWARRIVGMRGALCVAECGVWGCEASV
jgi:hypothetical protein